VSAPDKPDPARGWLYVEKLLEEADDERVKERSDDELRAEIRQGVASTKNDPVTEWSADELLARAEALASKEPPTAARAATVPPLPPPPKVASPPEKVAPVVPIRRMWRTVGLLAAASFALLLVVKLTRGPDIVAQAPSRQQLAAAIRDQAQASCAMKDWMACKASLDEAATLDPAGESEARVQKARQEIAAGVATPSVDGASVGPRP
jgi:hypothetical protein